MSFVSWLRSLKDRNSRVPARVIRRRPSRRRATPGRLSLELLEDRTLLSAYVVTKTADSGAGSLRDAINQINLDTNHVYASPSDSGKDEIDFAIPASDPRHVYYRDDNTSTPGAANGTLGLTLRTSTTRTSDSQILNRDPDYGSSWWSIQPTTPLPAITRPVIIDGYTQGQGTALAAKQNTLGIGPGSDGHLSGDGDNAILRIEISGEKLPGGTNGLTIDLRNSTDGKSSVVRGLVMNRFINAEGLDLLGNVGSVVAGNFLGPDVSGTLAPNGSNYYRHDPGSFVPYIADPQTLMHSGVTFSGGSGNTIGTDADGVNDSGERNLLSAANFAVVMGNFSTDNSVAGNFIGTNRYGKPPAVDNGPGPGSTQLGNLLGVAFINGAAADIGRTGVGQFDASRRNLISGNYFGASAGNASNGGGGTVSVAQIRGNWIGTDVTGNAPFGNMYGVVVFGTSGNPVGPGLVDGTVTQADALALGNVIAYNHGSAVSVADSSNPFVHVTVLSSGNYIRGNSIHDNWLDYQSAGGGAAIDLFGVVKYQYFHIYGDYGAGANWPIPLLASRRDPTAPLPPLVPEARPLLNGTRTTDATDLSNHFQTFPELTAAGAGAGTSVSFTFHSLPGRKYWIDFYATDQLGGLGSDGRYYGEGRTFLGSWPVTTDANGDAADTATLPTNLPAFANVYLTATATYADVSDASATFGDTSEFSADLTVPGTSIATLTSTNLQPVIDTVPAGATARTVLDVVPVPAGSKLVILSGWTDGQVHDIITAVNGLAPQSTPVTVVVNLGPGTFTGVTASPPAGVTLALVGNGTATTFVGHSPALTVLSGTVLASDLTLTDATDAPTVLVAGGNLTLRNVLVQESTGFDDAAIAVTGGTVDLGTAASPGGNVIQINGPGELIHNTTPNPIAATGNTFEADGAPLPALALSFTALTTSVNPVLADEPVTFLANVRANTPDSGTPTGSVDFVDATTGTDLGSVPLADGAAALTTSALAVGGHVIRARYDGDAGFLGSQDSAPVTVIPPGSLSGLVFEDFNDDGQVDFGETGIGGVAVTLTGTDDLGHTVNLSRTTDADGAYAFLHLRPGSYRLTETQPAGYLQGIDSVGTAGGSLAATDQFFVPVAAGADGLNYNFGERPTPTGPVRRGQTAGIGFWNNKNGQKLILAFNGGTGTQLGDWLAATLPHLYGTQSAYNLAGRSNADVAALFQQDFLMKGPKVDAQVLATALSVYATNATLDSTGVAARYGFTVSGDGVGTATVNVGGSGDAFGVANNTTLTVLDLLLAADAQAVHGVLYNGNTAKRKEANDVFSALNDAGGIG